MSLWLWLRRLFVLDVPALPPVGDGADDASLRRAAAEARAALARLERLARDRQLRIEALEANARLHQPDAGGGVWKALN